MTRRALALAVALASSGLLAQPGRADTDSNAGGWITGLVTGDFAKVDPRLGSVRWWFDAQVRLRDDTDGFSQALVRPALGYAVTDDLTLWAGYAWVRTSILGRRDVDEHRIWQQVTWSTKLASTTLALRPRLEQRIVETGEHVGWTFRQLAKLSHPIGFEGRLRAVGYDEVFFDLRDTDWGAKAGFAQNRFFAGFAWRFDEEGRAIAELGYLNQYVDLPVAVDLKNHLVSLNFFFK